MRASIILLAISLTTAYGFYLQNGPNRHFANAPDRRDSQDNELVLRSIADLFRRLSAPSSTSKRCANLFDESCANGGLDGAGSDDDWLHGGGNPGKRCANVFDEGCSNGGIPGAGRDEDWLGGGRSPGK